MAGTIRQAGEQAGIQGFAGLTLIRIGLRQRANMQMGDDVYWAPVSVRLGAASDFPAAFPCGTAGW